MKKKISPLKMLNKMRLRRGLYLFGKIGLTYQVMKTALAAGVSWTIAHKLLQSDYPIFAPLAAMLVIQVAIFDTIERAVYRVIGTVGGVVIGIMLGNFFGINILSIILVVLLSFAIATALRLPSYLVIQIAVSALLVLFFSHTQAGYAFARIFETLVGAAVAVTVNIFIFPPNPMPDLRKKVSGLCYQLGEILDKVSLEKKSNKHLYESLLELRRLVITVEDRLVEIEQADRSIRYSPLQRKYRVDAERLLLTTQVIEHMVSQIRGINRSLLDISIRAGHVYKMQPVLGEVAKCVVLFGYYIDDPGKQSVDLLNTAIAHAHEIHRESYSQWSNESRTIHFNIGSIFTDTYRILEEIDVYMRELDEEKTEDWRIKTD